jgi:cell division septation protein DedD
MKFTTLRKRRPLSFERCEPRLCMAASVGWDGAGRGSASLSYYVGDVPTNAGVTQSQFEAAVESALAAWSAVAAINFTQTAVAGQNDALDFTFARLDGSGGTLAQAYFPEDVNPARIAGDVQFDSSEQWEIGNARGNAAFDLVAVAVHEIGHALGLEHSHVGDSIMASSISAASTFTSLATTDKSSILQLYAPQSASNPTNTSPSTPLTPTVTTPSTTTPTTTKPTTPTSTTPTTPTTDSPTGNRPTNTWYRRVVYFYRWWNPFTTLTRQFTNQFHSLANTTFVTFTSRQR